MNGFLNFLPNIEALSASWYNNKLQPGQSQPHIYINLLTVFSPNGRIASYTNNHVSYRQP